MVPVTQGKDANVSADVVGEIQECMRAKTANGESAQIVQLLVQRDGFAMFVGNTLGTSMQSLRQIKNRCGAHHPRFMEIMTRMKV